MNALSRLSAAVRAGLGRIKALARSAYSALSRAALETMNAVAGTVAAGSAHAVRLVTAVVRIVFHSVVSRLDAIVGLRARAHAVSPAVRSQIALGVGLLLAALFGAPALLHAAWAAGLALAQWALIAGVVGLVLGRAGRANLPRSCRGLRVIAAAGLFWVAVASVPLGEMIDPVPAAITTAAVASPDDELVSPVAANPFSGPRSVVSPAGCGASRPPRDRRRDPVGARA